MLRKAEGVGRVGPATFSCTRQVWVDGDEESAKVLQAMLMAGRSTSGASDAPLSMLHEIAGSELLNQRVEHVGDAERGRGGGYGETSMSKVSCCDSSLRARTTQRWRENLIS